MGGIEWDGLSIAGRLRYSRTGEVKLDAWGRAYYVV